MAAIGASAVRAQGPQRQHAVRIPGSGDIMLEAGWRLLWTIDRHCSYAIPAAWLVSGDGRRAEQPDGTVSIRVTPMTVASWLTHRTALKAAMAPATVHEETTRRIWIERIDGRWAWQHISVSDGTRTCAADIETKMRDRVPDTISRIAASVRVARDGETERVRR